MNKAVDLTGYQRDKLVLDFIKRRFYLKNQTTPEDFENSHWMTGNCYWFAWILCNRFSWLELVYEPIDGHFLAFDRDFEVWYDYMGRHEDKARAIPLKTLKKMDPNWYRRIMQDCAD